ncbi:MAG TPA: NAD(P)-dependent oxidoreductase [Steroidobacteraceae bacterium]|nr:NAD(P)-dependent oxidoreductase [Steroidobacteraceae bacterium]
MMRNPHDRKLFLAGASGVIGRRLVPLLLQRGWHVVGTTRSSEKAKALAAAGAEPVVVDVFDARAIERAIAHAQPALVLHELTDLPPGLDPARMADAIARNARIRSEGTANLVAAALAARVPRMVAQSIAWAYAPQSRALREEDPLDLQAEGTRAISVRGIAELERCVLESPPLAGVVLRYGRLYGPGTGAEVAAPPSVHIDAAAWATVLAVERAEPGIYNVADPGPQLDSSKAQAKLDWSADWRIS